MTKTIILENTHNKLEISTFGAQVLSWESFVNKAWVNILYTGSSSKRSGIPVLFPFANPLENDIFLKTGAKMTQHGFARNSEWNLIEASQEKVILSLNFNDLDQVFKSAFPFPFDLSLEVKLNQNNSIDYTLTLKNLGEFEMPIAPGIHPYFSLDHGDKPSLKIKEIPQFSAQAFPWNTQLFGEFYPFKKEIRASFPDYDLNISEISQNPDCQFLVIWSQNQTEIDHDFVCLEPFYRQTNALNTNPILVKPGQIWTAGFRFLVR